MASASALLGGKDVDEPTTAPGWHVTIRRRDPKLTKADKKVKREFSSMGAAYSSLYRRLIGGGAVTLIASPIPGDVISGQAVKQRRLIDFSCTAT